MKRNGSGEVYGSDSTHTGRPARERRDPDFYAQIGKHGDPERERRGPDFYAQIGKKGGEVRREKPPVGTR